MTDVCRRYRVYGECLASTTPMPELADGDGRVARWTFDVRRELPPMRDARELGSDELYGTVRARLLAHDAGHRIVVDDTGAFDVSPDRSHISFAAQGAAWPDFVRAHLLGRVLATALFLDGLLPLHASAVETGAGVVGFLAPKGFGKSTLALALVSAGARLGTDDTLPVEPAPVPSAWPGVHSIRVREDAIEAVGVARPSLATREGKWVVSALSPAQLQQERRPLAALYLIDPVPAGAVGATREPLGPTLAAVATVAHVKIARMLGPAAASPMLERAAAIVGRVPVYRLRIPRDLAALSATARLLVSWHGAAS